MSQYSCLITLSITYDVRYVYNFTNGRVINKTSIFNCHCILHETLMRIQNLKKRNKQCTCHKNALLMYVNSNKKIVYCNYKTTWRLPFIALGHRFHFNDIYFIDHL